MSLSLVARAAVVATIGAAVLVPVACNSPNGNASFGGTFGSGGGFAGAGPLMACSKSADCLPGQLCCGKAGGVVTSCQDGPCPNTPQGVLQLCGTSAECLEPGSECGAAPAPVGFLNNAQICTPPDGGSGAMRGLGDDASASETSTSDDAPAIDDASWLGDSSPMEDGNDGNSDAIEAGKEGPTHD